MHFFKISKKTINKLTPYTLVDSIGRHIVVTRKDKKQDKRILTKDCSSHFDPEYPVDDDDMGEKLEQEIKKNISNFEVLKTYFCVEFIRLVSPALTSKPSLFNVGGKLHLGVELIQDLILWKQAFNCEKQMIVGHPINSEGDVVAPEGIKTVKGLGLAAVLLKLIGTADRHSENWGIVIKPRCIQTKLFDFDECLSFFEFTDLQDIPNKNLSDFISDVFEQYYDEDPLPEVFYKSKKMLAEVVDGINLLQELDFTIVEQMTDNIFKDFPIFKSVLLKEIEIGIDVLKMSLENDKDYRIFQAINRTLKSFGIKEYLSNFDNETLEHFYSMHLFCNGFEKNESDAYLKNYYQEYLHLVNEEPIEPKFRY